MKPIKIFTQTKTITGDLLTPVTIFLKIKERFQFPILLESTDYTVIQNSKSIIAYTPLSSLKVSINEKQIIIGKEVKKTQNADSLETIILDFMDTFEIEDTASVKLIGYSSYESITKIETLNIIRKDDEELDPLAFYSIYKYTITFNHYNDEILLTGNGFSKEEAVLALDEIMALLNVPFAGDTYFKKQGEEQSEETDEEYKTKVQYAIKHCQKGDVFQLVLSREFYQSFIGDDFLIYRTLRRINRSPYLYYFDLGTFKLIGSSPEAQLIIQDNIAEMHPIAGTYKRTQNDQEDLLRIEQLKKDPKENAEHMMLVDLARNDLSINCDKVQIKNLKEIVMYSHVIHLVSKVVGVLKKTTRAFSVLCNTFPAGTLSGAPKYKAMELIYKYEKKHRNFYGGNIGIIGFDNTMNQAIIIRTIKSKNNKLYIRAGAGIVINSNPESELQEVNNKLNALRTAINITHEHYKN